ncbi:hypothetical protein ACOSZF_10465 [Cytobacillus firmus]|uniref:hypothetical protein n=1 Tax=Cytobacillus firmus TaxID=1399 RepID=UPI0036F234AD
MVVDTLEGVLHEASDFIVPQKAGLWCSDSIYSEIGEIICCKKVGRETQSEITFYKSVGIGYLDHGCN